jgi:tRNA modification GTPase
VNSVILLTPPGAAAIAVVRLAGDRTPGFLRKYFSRSCEAGRAIHGTLADGDQIIDDPLVVLHAGGQTADLNLHGGPWVVRQVLELANRAGFQMVPSNQVPLPAQAVDGADEIEIAMLAHLPAARTELALRWLAAQPAVRRRWKRRGDLAVQADRSLWWLLNPPRVAIVGAANVGKSTLANQLFAQERSIIADVPGTTRDWVGEMADIDGLAIHLIDTPGLRDTDDGIERAAIAASETQVKQADLVALVVDASRPMEEQKSWVEKFPTALVVRNKCDRAVSSAPLDGVRPHVFTVASEGGGVDALRQAIRRRFIRPWQDAYRPREWINPS